VVLKVKGNCGLVPVPVLLVVFVDIVVLFVVVVDALNFVIGNKNVFDIQVNIIWFSPKSSTNNKYTTKGNNNDKLKQLV